MQHKLILHFFSFLFVLYVLKGICTQSSLNGESDYPYGTWECRSTPSGLSHPYCGLDEALCLEKSSFRKDINTVPPHVPFFLLVSVSSSCARRKGDFLGSFIASHSYLFAHWSPQNMNIPCWVSYYQANFPFPIITASHPCLVLH